jgi:hypothetical protein
MAQALAMISRCRDKNNEYYGAKGVLVCDRWLSFENFLADMGERPEGKTLDRCPNRDGNYEPKNCRWATPQQQRINTDYVDNSVGVTERDGRFQSRIQRGHSFTLGTFDTEEEAIAVRRPVKEHLDAADAIITAVTLRALRAVAGPLPDRTMTPFAASTMTAAQACPSGFTTQSIRDGAMIVVPNYGRFSRRSRALQMRILSLAGGWSRRRLAFIFPKSIWPTRAHAG